MILIPEIEKVLLLVPRTGSGSLRRAVLARYPQAMQVYRHMEADGVPIGYDHWQKVGVVRNPLDRLWSLYKFLGRFGIAHQRYEHAYTKAQRDSVDRPFDEWILRNKEVFTSPYDSAGLSRFWPQFCVRHPIPENVKSQWLTLRPDLGTEIWRYEDLHKLAVMLDITLERHNETAPNPVPKISLEASEHVGRVFKWDYLYWEASS